MKKTSSSYTRALILVGSLLSSNIATAEVSVKPYGFIKPDYSGATEPVMSFGNRNLVSATAAAPPEQVPVSQGYRGRFSIGQTRLGLDFAAPSKWTARVEVDFIDFTKSAPTTTTVPRLRIAKVEHDFSDRLGISAGQDWDVFSSLMPHSFNYVGASFQAGNSGFMRHQVVLHIKPSAFQLDLGVGSTGVNTTSIDGAVEETAMPTFLARLTHKFTAQSRWGISGLVNQRTYFSGVGATGVREDRTVAGSNLFTDFDLGADINLRSEVYYGLNLADSNSTLTLAQGAYGTSLHEWGGYVSARHQTTESLSVFATVGLAKVVEGDRVQSFGTAGYLGIRENTKAAFGAAWKLAPETHVYVEISRYVTQYQVGGRPSVGQASVFETGLVYVL